MSRSSLLRIDHPSLNDGSPTCGLSHSHGQEEDEEDSAGELGMIHCAGPWGPGCRTPTGGWVINVHIPESPCKCTVQLDMAKGYEAALEEGIPGGRAILGITRCCVTCCTIGRMERDFLTHYYFIVLALPGDRGSYK